MGQTVYADLLFLINFSMDFLCLYLTSRLLHRRVRLWRATLACVVGGIYAVGALFIGADFFFGMFIDALVCMLMCVIAYCDAKTGFWRICGITALYFLISAALGGLMTAMFNLLNSLELPLGEIDGSGDGISLWLFALLAAASGIAALTGGNFFRRKTSVKTAKVEITYKDKKVSFDALCDSGNLLRDPVDGKRVVVVDIDSAAPLLSPSLVRSIRRGELAVMGIYGEDAEYEGMRLIPAKTASGGGIITAFRPDRMTVIPSDGKNAPHDTDALFAPAAIGKSADGNNALLPPELLV